jgi:molybdopterin-containing oxidoreductase family iron-sulfur binding subunit
MEPQARLTGPANPSRRRFLQALAAGGATVGASVAAAALSSPTTQSQDSTPAEEPQHAAGTAEAARSGGAAPSVPLSKRRWAFVVDLRLCDGCDKCTEACQKTHYLTPDQRWIDVYRMTSSSGQAYAMPRLCMHCENPPCEKVCPVGATYQNDEGIVLVDQKICIGCRMCMAACPYEARYFNWNEPPATPPELTQPMPEFPVPQKRGTVGKCILCVHYQETGQLPACVEGCPMGALYIGDLEADIATNGEETVKLSSFLRENDAIRYKEELGTRPRVFYILGHGQDYTY